MAKVYLAHDEVLDRDVALKVLREQYAENEAFVERFRQEARSAARLSHPNIVAVHDWGRSEEGTYYMAMEYVPGGTLKERITREGALDPGIVIGVAIRIAEALLAAHENGVIHRDIKPQNVLVTAAGGVKVTDFGIAQAIFAPTTETSAVLGTAAYMAPEQAMSEPVSPQSDLYSLGVVFFEMLTGELPYTAKGPIAQAMKHVNEPPRSPKVSNPDVPEALDALTVKLLAKNPEERCASAAELVEELEQTRSALPSVAKKTGKTATPLPPLPPDKRAQMEPTVLLPVAAPAIGPGHGRRLRGRLLPTLAASLFVGLLGVFALSYSGPEGYGNSSGAEQTVPAEATPAPQASAPQAPAPPIPPADAKENAGPKAAGKVGAGGLPK